MAVVARLALERNGMRVEEDLAEMYANALELMEKQLFEAEHKIIGYHSVQLARFTREQQLAVQQAADLDNSAMERGAASVAICRNEILTDLQSNATKREGMTGAATEERERLNRLLRDELEDMGDARSEEVNACLRQSKEAIRASSLDWEETAWEDLDSTLVGISWRLAISSHSSSPVGGVVEVHNSGALQPFLDSERDGWKRSQTTDLERLKTEVDQECQHIIDGLMDKLHTVEPGNFLTAPPFAAVEEMVAYEKQRLANIEKEVCSHFASEIDSALHSCEEDFRGYDCELQEVIFRTLAQRFTNASEMRQLKLALCRWRLDYQKAYHEQCAQTSERLHNALKEDEDSRRVTLQSQFKRHQETSVKGRKQLETLRNVVGRIWSHGRVPVSEIHKFISRVSEALHRAGLAAPIEELYEAELKEYGACPLIENAYSPELLNCWLDSLTAHGRDREDHRP